MKKAIFFFKHFLKCASDCYSRKESSIISDWSDWQLVYTMENTIYFDLTCCDGIKYTSQLYTRPRKIFLSLQAGQNFPPEWQIANFPYVFLYFSLKITNFSGKELPFIHFFPVVIAYNLSVQAGFYTMLTQIWIHNNIYLSREIYMFGRNVHNYRHSKAWF